MTARALLQTAKSFEADVVIPHCAVCTRPCCGLSDVVLELSFPQVQRLYGITRSKKEFDTDLPSMIRKQEDDDRGLRTDRYYAHGEPCPAYDTTSRRCGVYATSTKPRSCSDFPLYDDGGALTADLRCEAVRDQLPVLRARLRALSGPRLVEQRDPDHPEIFVSFELSKAKTPKTPKTKARSP